MLTQEYRIDSDISDIASEGSAPAASAPAAMDADWNFQPDRDENADVSRTETYDSDRTEGMIDYLDAPTKHIIQSLVLNVDITEVHSPPVLPK